MLEDFRLKVFMTVSKEGSFTKAASVLGVTQPAVSQNVADLERLTGRKLFERMRGEVALTSQGRVFMEYVLKHMEISSQMTNMFSSFAQSSVRVSASEELYALFLAPALEKFLTVHPEIVFERSIFESADLILTLKPASDSVFEIPSESICRLKISCAKTPQTGDYKATREKISYYDILFQPSETFACTRLCRVLKEFLTSF